MSIMKNFSPSIFKSIIYSTLAIVVVLSPIIALNIFLNKEKNTIEEFASASCGQKVYVGNIRFFPPNKIIIRNISFDSMFIPGNERPFSIDELRVVFSLKKLILNKEFYIGKIIVKRPKLDLSNYAVFGLDTKRIVSTLKEALKDKKVRVIIKNGVIISSLRPIDLNAAVDIDEEKNISASGSLFFGPPRIYNFTNEGGVSLDGFRYKFKARLNEKGVDIDNLEIMNSNIHTKLLGKINKNVLVMGGMIIHNSITREPKGQLINKLKSLFHKNRHAAFDIIGPSFHSLNVYDLSMRMKLSKHKVVVKYIKFSLNNIPFCLKGYFSFSNKIGINLSFSSYPDLSISAGNSSFKKADLTCSGSYSKDEFDGNIVLNFFKNIRTNEVHHKIRLNLQGLSFAFSGNSGIRIKCDKADTNYTVGNNAHRILLEGFNSLWDISDPRIKLFSFTSRIYDGFLKGFGYLNVGRMPFKSSYVMGINNVSAQNLRNITMYFDKIHGNLSSFLRYRNHPYSHLYGNFDVRDGYLDNIMFFKWLAGFFDLPGLKKLRFNKISGKFSVDSNASRLEDIDLQSANVGLNGNFSVSADGMVSSKLFLTFSDKLLNTSAKFKHLLKLLGRENAKLVNFDFQLSGLFNAMNFQWLKSDFKERLKELLPPMVERILEKRIEKAVESISGK